MNELDLHSYECYNRQQGGVNMKSEYIQDGYIGSKEASDILGVTQATISKWCRNNKFNSAEQDAKCSPWRISRQEVEDMKIER